MEILEEGAAAKDTTKQTHASMVRTPKKNGTRKKQDGMVRRWKGEVARWWKAHTKSGEVWKLFMPLLALPMDTSPRALIF